MRDLTQDAIRNGWQVGFVGTSVLPDMGIPCYAITTNVLKCPSTSGPVTPRDPFDGLCLPILVVP